MSKKSSPSSKLFPKIQLKLAFAAILCVGVILYLYNSQFNCCTNTVSNSNQYKSQPADLFDGGYNHTYHVNSTITGLDVNLNSRLIPFMSIHGNTLLTGTGPSIGTGAHFNGSVVALNTDSGEIIWRTILPNFVMSQPLVVGNYVIVEMGKSNPSSPNGIIALNINNGSIAWSIITNQTAMVMPIYINNVIYVSGGEFMYLINPKNGTIIKSFLPGSEISMAQPILVNGAIYQNLYYNGNYFVTAINTSTWKITWEANIKNATSLTDTTPSFYLGNIIIGYYDNGPNAKELDPLGTIIIEGLNSSDGKMAWRNILYNNTQNIAYGYTYPSFKQFGPALSPITLHNGIGYVDSAVQGTLYAFNATTGKVSWIFETDGDNANPNIINGYLFIVNEGGELFVINATSGNFLFAKNIGMPDIANGPIIAGNSLIVGSINGIIKSFPLNSINSFTNTSYLD